MHLIEAFVRNPVKVSVGVLLVMLFGFIALTRMPMQLTPEVQIPTLTIETRWPGASPQEVETEIIQEQEEQLKGVEGVNKMTSESMDSMGRITLEFAVGTDMGEALLLVNTRLQQVPQYPEDADEPVISTSNSSDRPIAWFILGPRMPTEEELQTFAKENPETAADIESVRTAPNTGVALIRLKETAQKHPKAQALLPKVEDIPKLRRFAEDFIEARFERVPGVSNSNVMGGREEEMQVVVDPQRLAARHLTINDVRVALRGENKDTSGGDFWEGKRRYVVRTLGQFRSPKDIEDVIIARQNDVPVYIRDVAEVRIGYKKPDGLVRHLGTTCIAINAMRETDANVLDVMQGLRDVNAALNAGILKERGLYLEQVYDETDYIYSSIELVNSNIVVGGLLTVAVLLLFLRSGRSTLVIALAIPTSIIGSFLVMNLMGRSLNVISLAGMAFAVGMLVDNSVVVLENVYRHFQMGKDRFRAAVDGTNEVWGAVLASTLTTLAVFLPVLFVEEEAGQLFRDIALAISAAVGLSLIVSITVIPTAAAKIFRRNRFTNESEPERTGLVGKLLSPFDRIGMLFTDLLVGVNAWLQSGVIRRLVVVVGFVGLSLAVTYIIRPKVEYLPTGNRNLVFGILLPPPGYNLDQLMEIGERIEQDLKPYWNVTPGSPEAAQLDFPVIGDFFYVARGRQVFMGIRAADPMKAADLVPLVQKVSRVIPGTFGVAKQSSLFEQGLTAGRTIEIEIVGPELTRLIELGGRIFGQVMQIIPNAQARPVPSLDLSSPEIHIKPKREHAADMGVLAVDLGYSVDALIDGAYATDYFTGGDKIDLTIIGQEEYANRTQSLAQLPVATPTGELVPLAAVANVELSSGPEQINRRERQRAITIEVSPPPEMALEDAMDKIVSQIVEPLRESGELQGLYEIGLAGTADKLRDTWMALRFNFVLALFITYLLMAALFESWLYPFVIIMSVPLGAVGGVVGLALLNWYIAPTVQPLDVLTMLGFVILIGTVVNNPILIVEQALILMREEGMPQRQAILEGTRTRIRPIFMTTMTTVLGLLPLVLFPGSGSELYRGLGSVVLGGLLMSTFVSLVVVPTLFSLSMEARERFIGLVRWITRSKPETKDEDEESVIETVPQEQPEPAAAGS